MLTLPRERMLPFAEVRQSWYRGEAQAHARLIEYPEVQAIWTGWEWVGPEDGMGSGVFLQYTHKSLRSLFSDIEKNDAKRADFIEAGRPLPGGYFVTPYTSPPDWEDILHGEDFSDLIPGLDTGWEDRS